MKTRYAILLLLSLNACVTTQQNETLSMPAAFIGEWIPNQAAKGFRIFITPDGKFDYRDRENRPENKQYESYGTYKVVHVANENDVYFILHMVNADDGSAAYSYRRLHSEKEVFYGNMYIRTSDTNCNLRLTQEIWDTYSNKRHWQALMKSRRKDASNPDYNEDVPCKFGNSINRYHRR